MSDWYPSGYCARDAQRSEGRCPPNGDGPPHYPRFPVIVVRDFAHRHLDSDRLKFWRRARDGAVAEWVEVGFKLRVRETLGRRYRSGRIHLDVTQTQDGTRGQADFGFLADGTKLPGVAWAHVDLETGFNGPYFARTVGPLRRLVAHEIGHLFGFGHAPSGKVGLMTDYADGNLSAEEVAAARSFWFPLEPV